MKKVKINTASGLEALLKLIAEEKVKTNSLTTIYLDKYNFKPSDLPIFYCPNMAGIPFGLGISRAILAY